VTAAWLTTEQVCALLQLDRCTLRALIRAPVERPAWVRYSGRADSTSARYRWEASRLNAWFREASEWQASAGRAIAGSSDGETEEDGAPTPTLSPSTPGRPRKPSAAKSKRRSTASGSTNLVELARRLVSG
jgi:hypothetical protein